MKIKKNNFFTRFLKLLIKNLVNFFYCFKRPEVQKFDNVTYIAMMEGLAANQCFLHEFFKEMKVPITVLGPYHHKLKCRRFLVKIFGWPYGKADFFWTEELMEPRFDLAHKQIGYWTSFKNNKDVYRCPSWMNQLDFSEGKDGDNKSSWYYGNKLSIDKLMKPILNSYSYEDIKNRLNKSILISSHFKPPRRRLFNLVNSAIGCDGFGRAFKNQDYNTPKKNLLEKYIFNLCPENKIGEGYISEKILHAFYAGCIPISWCRPEDLKEDFNLEAVVNLFGLDDKQICDLLIELSQDEVLLKKYLSVPLLLKRPQIKSLINFIKS